MAKLRESTFRTVWDHHEQRTQEIASQVDLKILNDVRNFVKSADAPASRLQTGLMVSGANQNIQQQLLKRLREDIEHSNNIFIKLKAGQSPNLQSALKHVIREAIEEVSGQEELRLVLGLKEAPHSYDFRSRAS